MNSALAFLTRLFQQAVASAQPHVCLPPYLSDERKSPALVVGAGKAAAAMAKVFEDHWQDEVRGLVVTRHGHGQSCRSIRIIEAGHPLPDHTARQAAEDMRHLLRDRRPDEKIFFLASGGGSALLTLPATPIDFDEKRRISAALLRSGAAIDEINCVRKHLSALKGGRLAALCEPALVTTYAISDVPGNDPAVIASGPTVADPTTSAQALMILERYRIPVSSGVRQWLDSPYSETPKPGSLLSHPFHVIATPAQALQAAAAFARSCGITPIILGDQIEGEAREVAKVMAGIAKSIQDTGEPAQPPCVLLSGGETSVTVRGGGKGGRNTEFLLGLSLALRGRRGIYGLAADSDGIDGSEDNAGAWLHPESLARAHAIGLEASQLLDNNDSYRFFAELGDLVITGPTRTNVNDIRAIYIT
jgi:hydroxypyruvate reductase